MEHVRTINGSYYIKYFFVRRDMLSAQETMKSHIIETTIKMIQEGFDVDVLTVRKIADKAKVSIGLINYYFGSKDKLLYEVIESIITRTSMAEFPDQATMKKSPRDKLRDFLVGISVIVAQYEDYSRLLLRYDFLSNEFSTPSQIVGFLAEMKPDLSDDEIKWLAVMVVAPLQYAFFKKDMFETYFDGMRFDPMQLVDTHLKSLGL